MKTYLVTASLLALAVGANACSSGSGSHSLPPQIKDLTIEQEVTVDFDEMAKDVAEEAVIAFDDLRKEARYNELRNELVCAGLDLGKSRIEITDLSGGPAAPVPLVYQIDVSEAGQNQWVMLAEFNAAVEEREVHAFSDPKFTVFEDGREKLALIALSDRPIYDVRVTGEVDDAVTNLMIDMHLEMFFSNTNGSCP